MALDLSRVGEREKLKARREPYWQRLRESCFLGFRPSKKAGPGTWIARAYDADTGKQKHKSLGDFGELAGNKRFAAAKAEAEKHAELVEVGGVLAVKVETVGDACRVYAEGKPEAEARFMRHLYDDPLAKLKLDKLRRRQLAEWRKRLEEKPSLVSRSKRGAQRTRARAPATVNRDMAVLRAALSKVLAPGTPNTEAAWQSALKAIPNADRKRERYLDREQRELLLKSISDEAAPFVTALCRLPLRPGAMAKLSAGDFDKRTFELTVRHDKTREGRRIRLPEEIGKLIAKQSKDKLPSAPLFMRSNGKGWDKNYWNEPIAAAAKAAGLEAGITTYTLRHSVITDLVVANKPLLTVAQIAGTSVEMIERHYGHLVGSAAVAVLEELSA